MVLAELGGKLRDSLRQLQHGGGSGGGGSRTARGGVTAAELNAVLSDIARALIEADVNVRLVARLRENIKRRAEPHLRRLEGADEADEGAGGAEPGAHRQRLAAAAAARQHAAVAKLVQRAVVDELTALLRPPPPPSPSSGGGGNGTAQSSGAYRMRRGAVNVILFVGLQGAGKTTTVAKFAHYYQKRGWKCAMVCADTFRAGALDQLRQNATKLRVPFYGSPGQADPVALAADGVAQFRRDRYEVILVDTSGRHRQEAGLLEEMREIALAVQPDNTVLVMDATQGQAVYDHAAAFHAAVAVGAVIVTKLDGHAKGGGALSAVAATASPVIFTGAGEHFDDLEAFDAASFVGQLLGFGNVRGLMDAMHGDDDGDGKKQAELMEKLSKGEFTLRDMYNQFEKILNMGVRFFSYVARKRCCGGFDGSLTLDAPKRISSAHQILRCHFFPLVLVFFFLAAQ